MDNFFYKYNDFINFKDWKVGIYTRLSNADMKEDHLKQSESIANQIELLKRFVKFKGWTILKKYIDDGYSGSNFDRPDFKRMIQDIEVGKINVVITKDLSRLGRDYIETGYYIEKYFPTKNVRYIAINDNIDTFDINNTNNDITPFKSVINDTYARDTSKKVRSILMTMALNGKSIKPFQPYGLKKDPTNKNNVLIDEEVSKNVYNIFMMYKNGMTKKEICNYLNEHNISTPLKYKELKSNYYNPNNNKTYKWTNTVVNKILRDRSYVGDLVQHKTTKVNYKINKHIKVDESNQIIIENCFPAIIDRQTFNIVQEILNKQANEWNYKSSAHHLLRGITFCSCGAKITYCKNHNKNFRCICSNYKKYGKKICTNVHLTENDLIDSVLNDLKKIIFSYFTPGRIKIDFNKNSIDRNLLLKLIDKIVINDNEIHIAYKFASPENS